MDSKRYSIKIMAPITSENIEVAQELSKHFQVKHIPIGYLGTTIVDGNQLFQFTDLLFQETPDVRKHFEKTFYSNDSQYVTKTQSMLDDIWKNAKSPAVINLISINNTAIQHSVYRATKKMDNLSVFHDEISKDLTEAEILETIVNSQKNPNSSGSTDLIRTFGTNGQAIIHPPSRMKLPEMLIHTYHMEKNSTHGIEDAIMVHLWLDSPRGSAYVLSAVVTDNANALDFWRNVTEGSPAAQNVHLVKRDEIQNIIHGNVLFAGWIVKIPLLNQGILPPGYLKIEGYGNVKTDAYTAKLPSGYTLKTRAMFLKRLSPSCTHYRSTLDQEPMEPSVEM